MTDRRDPTNACTSHEASLHDLLVGELASEERLQLERHLASCGSCRRALEEARAGLEALEELEASPLPFPDLASRPSLGAPEARWLAFRERWVAPPPRAEPWGIRLLAAAALLMLGLGLGVQLGSRPAAPILTAERGGEDAATSGATVASLARAEVLSDVGVGYTQGLRSLLERMDHWDADKATSAELEETREIARDLVRDGRLLRRSLDPERDRTLLAAVDRAELVLEEIAAVGSAGLGAPSSSIRLAVHDDVLRERLTTVKLDSRRDERAVASRQGSGGSRPRQGKDIAP